MHGDDAVPGVLRQIHQPHARVVGPDDCHSAFLLYPGSDGQGLRGVGSVICGYQHHGPAQHTAGAVNFFHGQLHASQHVLPVGSLGAGKRRLEGDDDGGGATVLFLEAAGQWQSQREQRWQKSGANREMQQGEDSVRALNGRTHAECSPKG